MVLHKAGKSFCLEYSSGNIQGKCVILPPSKRLLPLSLSWAAATLHRVQVAKTTSSEFLIPLLIQDDVIFLSIVKAAIDETATAQQPPLASCFVVRLRDYEISGFCVYRNHSDRNTGCAPCDIMEGRFPDVLVQTF